MTGAIFGAFLTFSAAWGAPIELVRGFHFLEGTIFVGERLYFVDYTTSDVLRLDGTHVTKIWHQDGCGANGLVAVSDGLWVACYDSGRIVRISFDGVPLETIATDNNHKPFVSPNDLVADEKGGVYMTASGSGDKILGAVYYLQRDHKARIVASGLHNANGIALSKDGKLLYVGESNLSRISTYVVEDNADLGQRTDLVDLKGALANNERQKYTPDGFRVGKDGYLLVCLYHGGGVAIFDPKGKLAFRIDLPAAHHTSLAITPDNLSIVVTAVDDVAGGYRGTLYRVANPLAQ